MALPSLLPGLSTHFLHLPLYPILSPIHGLFSSSSAVGHLLMVPEVLLPCPQTGIAPGSLGGRGAEAETATLAPAAGWPGTEAEVAAVPAWPGLAEGRRRAGAMAEAGPQAPPPPGTPSRHEKSLGLLTTKFVSLLQEAKDGVLDLKLVRPGLRGDREDGGPGRPGPVVGTHGAVQLSPQKASRHGCAFSQEGGRGQFHSFGRSHWASAMCQALGCSCWSSWPSSAGVGRRASEHQFRLCRPLPASRS